MIMNRTDWSPKRTVTTLVLKDDQTPQPYGYAKRMSALSDVQTRSALLHDRSGAWFVR